jgi:heptosyltransferase-2
LGISQNIKTISYYAPTSAVEIDTFGLGKKIISTSEDYCSYHSEVDTSSITAERIFEEFNNMLNLNIICSNSEK